jgi:FdhE protein
MPLLPILKPRNRSSWDARVARARQLAESSSSAKEVLGFYARILEFQHGVYSRYRKNRLIQNARTLRECIDLEQAATDLPALFALVRCYGPPKLAEQAARLSCETRSNIVGDWLNPNSHTDSPVGFFSRVVLEPQAEYLAENWPSIPAQLAGNRCPHCEVLPQMAVLRPEGNGGKRMLLCSLCHSEWEFRRVFCPSCGEENHEKLPRFSAEGVKAVCVEACDSCGNYLKSVDLTTDGLAVPEVDEVATAPLDLWAVERGYHKIQVNLMGF